MEAERLFEPDRPSLVSFRSAIVPSAEAISDEVVLGLVQEWLELDDRSVLQAAVADVLVLTEASPENGFLVASLTQIAEAQSLDRARYYLARLEKALTSTRTSAVNDVDLNRWQQYEDILTDSLWIIDRRDRSGVHHAGYWGNFIPQIPNQMLKRYTKQGEWVLDPFVGSGTTLIEAQRLGRNGLGIELQPGVADHARELLTQEVNPDVTVAVEVADSRTADYPGILARHGQSSVQLVVMHPPYFDIVKFSDDPRDLSNAPSVDGFLEGMHEVITACSSVLDRGRFLAIVIGDKYEKGEWIPLGFKTLEVAQEAGFRLKSIIVKNFDETTAKRTQKELWRYRALVGGFYVFKHEYIFVLQKR